MSNPLILGTNSIKDTGYDVANSVRFNDGDSPRLTRTNSSNGSLTNWTFSIWVKRSSGGARKRLLHCRNSGGTQTAEISFNNSDQLEYYATDGSNVDNLKTNRVFRDFSAWYNIVIVWDSDNSTESDRIRFFVNGKRETSFATENYPSLNQESMMSKGTDASTIGLGYESVGNSDYFDGYICEAVFLDGTASTTDALEFGEFDTDSPNIWKPIDVSGLTFGTKGYYLDFENASSLGADVSGNSNNFTVNNLTSVDQSTDTCTNNFATWNPLHPGVTLFTNCVFADGNLEFESNETGYVVYPIAKSTIGVSSGKWYAEFKVLEENAILGISDGIGNENFIGGSTSNGVVYQKDGQKRVGNTESSYGDSYTANDIIGIAMDLDNNRVFFSKNGTFQDSGDPTSSTGAITIPTSSTGVFHFATLDTVSSGTSKVTANFGSPAFSISSGNSDANGHGNFEYAVPSGYLALCTKNLARSG